MGNCCSSSKSDDPFAGPGRVLGSAPAPPDRVAVPQHVGGPGRTLGGAGASSDADDPRSAAARAAQARQQQAQSPAKGKLSGQLAAQKSQTRASLLDQASREERGARDQDANAAARAWN